MAGGMGLEAVLSGLTESSFGSRLPLKQIEFGPCHLSDQCKQRTHTVASP